MTRPTDEIKAAIRFYEKRGWGWLDVVAFISARALGTLPDDVRLAYQRQTHRKRAALPVSEREERP